MSIDEVIKRIKEKMACDYNISGCNTCNISSCEDKDIVIQIEEWMEELKELRETSCGYRKEDIELNRNAMYNKAIDDFADKLKQDVMTITFGLRICDIDRIAEQLKVGGENDNKAI